jgi:hypothetical protein
MPKESKRIKRVKKRGRKRVAKRVPKKTEQKGGQFNDPIAWDSIRTTSVSGGFGNFVYSIVGLVESSVNAVVDTVNLITQASQIPMDLHKAYDGPSDPNIYNVNNI